MSSASWGPPNKPMKLTGRLGRPQLTGKALRGRQRTRLSKIGEVAALFRYPVKPMSSELLAVADLGRHES